MASSVGRLGAALLVCIVVPATVAAHELEVTERAVVSGTSGQERFAFAGPPRCDPKGNLFVVPLTGSSVEAEGLWRISADGRDVAHLRPRSLPGFERAGLMATALGSDGRAHVLVAVAKKGEQREQYIMTFDRKGESKSKPIQLKGLQATSVAAFDSGRYLIVGSTEDVGPALFVVSPDGNVVTTVRPPDDPAARPADAQEAVEPPSESDWRSLADLTFGESTDDGHVIMVRPTLQGPVYKIASSGEVVEQLTLVPPVGVTSLLTVKVSRGRLAALYKMDPDDAGRPRSIVAIFDLATHVKLAEYSSALGIFSCYETDGSTDNFRFLKVEGEGLVVVQAREH